MEKIREFLMKDQDGAFELAVCLTISAIVSLPLITVLSAAWRN